MTSSFFTNTRRNPNFYIYTKTPSKNQGVKKMTQSKYLQYKYNLEVFL
jgi:hypothetical protein